MHAGDPLSSRPTGPLERRSARLPKTRRIHMADGSQPLALGNKRVHFPCCEFIFVVSPIPPKRCCPIWGTFHFPGSLLLERREFDKTISLSSHTPVLGFVPSIEPQTTPGCRIRPRVPSASCAGGRSPALPTWQVTRGRVSRAPRSEWKRCA